ncbi:MAG: beta-propeller domain-containing protein [Sulfolobales archaeon]
MVLGVIALVLGTLTPIAIDTAFKGGYIPIKTQNTDTTTQILASFKDVEGVISSELKSFKSYDDVVDYIITLDRAKTLASLLVGSQFTLTTARAEVLGLQLTTSTLTSAPTTTAKTVRTPGTNVQVVGVDEPDMVKCDSKILAVASSNKVSLVGIKERKVLSLVDLKDEQVGGLFLYDDVLVVLTTKPNNNPIILDLGLRCRCNVIIPPGVSNTTIYLYDISSPNNPKLKNKYTITGTLFTSRMNGKYIYIITTLPISGPTMPLINDAPLKTENIVKVDAIPTTYTVITALDVSTNLHSSYAFMTGYNSWLYMSPNNLYLASIKALSILEAYNAVVNAIIKYLPSNIASVVREHLEKGDLEKCIDFISEYFSSRSYDEVRDLLIRVSNDLSSRVFGESSKFYVFSIKGINVSFSGTFEVSGRVLDQFSMEELGNYFIVATTSTTSIIKVRYDQPVIIAPIPREDVVEVIECNDSRCVVRTITLTQTPQRQWYKPRVHIDIVPAGETENNVFTISLKELKVVGALRSLAEGERVYASRLIGNTFYLVTYRQVDPLFAIDVSDPEKPKVLGYLKIPGFSEYLHPLRNNKLLGIGIEDGGLKISLFDVSDPTKMAEISKVRVPKAWSIAYYDHHAVTIDVDNELTFIPVSVGSTSGILTISYRDDVLKVKKLIEHEGAMRTTYVDNELYTISTDMVKVYDISSLSLIQEIKLST